MESDCLLTYDLWAYDRLSKNTSQDPEICYCHVQCSTKEWMVICHSTKQGNVNVSSFSQQNDYKNKAKQLDC